MPCDGQSRNSRFGEWTAVAAIVPGAMFDGAADSAVPLVPPLTGRTVAIVHPAWHSCGSHQVFVSQVRAYRSLGAKVISVAIADAPGATEGSNQHKSYMAATADLEADLRHFTGIPLHGF